MVRNRSMKYRKVNNGIERDAVMPLFHLLSYTAPQSIWDLLKQLKEALLAYIKYAPLPKKITYKLTEGGPNLTGLIVTPNDMSSPPKIVKAPIIALQHPTQTLREYSPSRNDFLHDDELAVTAATALDGPYSLSDTMRNLNAESGQKLYRPVFSALCHLPVTAPLLLFKNAQSTWGGRPNVDFERFPEFIPGAASMAER